MNATTGEPQQKPAFKECHFGIGNVVRINTHNPALLKSPIGHCAKRFGFDEFCEFCGFRRETRERNRNLERFLRIVVKKSSDLVVEFVEINYFYR